MFFRFICLVSAILVCTVGWAPESWAQQRISLIRDAEIERIIQGYATPLFEAAALDPAAVQIHLVSDPTLNAFVAGGQHLFLNTGLLMRADNASQLMGVIAHETGHIAGGHLIRGQEAMRNAGTQMLLAVLLGIGAGIASGSGDATTAILSGGSSVATRGFLQFSQGQEAAADQAGLGYLDKTGTSAKGFLEFLEILEKQDPLNSDRRDPYVRTHPLTRDRVDFVRNHVLQKSAPPESPLSPQGLRDFERMQAKLIGFMEPFRTVLKRYPEKDTSEAARYARAVAYYRRGELDRSVPLIDGLIAEEPTNPYFHELRGQMLFENGRLAEALSSYTEAVRFAPESVLLRIGLAHIQLETEDALQNRSAMGNLLYAADRERDNPELWRLLAIGYGRDQEFGMSALSLAEEAISIGDKVTAVQQATRAQKILDRGSPGWIRAQDIKIAANTLPDP